MTARNTKSTKIKVLSLMLPAAMLAGNVSAGGSDNNYVELGYTSHDYGALSKELTGFEIAGAKMIDEMFFGFGSYFIVDEDIASQNVELKSIKIGAGYTRAVDDKTDFIAKVMYIDDELNSKIVDRGETGFGASVGASYAVMDELSLSAELLMDDVEDSDMTFTFGTVYKLPEYVSLFGELSHSDDGETISIGARYSF